MEPVTKEQWMQALLGLKQGGRLNPLLSIMSGGTLQQIRWMTDITTEPMDASIQADYIQQMLAQAQVESQFVIAPIPWQGAAVLTTDAGQNGLLVCAAYAAAEDFQQAQLQQQLHWLQQMAQLNDFPVRLLLLAFCKVPDGEAQQPGMLETWQWEELLETGLQMATGQQAALAEVLILPMVAYPAWLDG